MFFDEEFISEVEENPVAGIVQACVRAEDKLEELDNGEKWTEAEHELLWEVASFIKIIIDVNDLGFEGELPNPTGEIAVNCQPLKTYVSSVYEHFNALHTEQLTLLNVKKYQKRYETVLKGAFCYEFSQGDLERVQLLVNEIRDHVSNNPFLDGDHKRRLLKRLEQLQSELHKKVSDLDRFWGMVGDAGVVLGKLGTDAKPIVDRVREVAEIVWKTQARTEELPSSAQNPMLDQDENT